MIAVIEVYDVQVNYGNIKDFNSPGTGQDFYF